MKTTKPYIGLLFVCILLTLVSISFGQQQLNHSDNQHNHEEQPKTTIGFYNISELASQPISHELKPLIYAIKDGTEIKDRISFRLSEPKVGTLFCGGMEDVPILSLSEFAEHTMYLIRDAVDPESWRNNGGSVSIINHSSGVLIVTTTEENHKQIRILLDNLERNHRINIITNVQLFSMKATELHKIRHATNGTLIINAEQSKSLMDKIVNDESFQRFASLKLSSFNRQTVFGTTSKNTQSALAVLISANHTPESGRIMMRIKADAISNSENAFGEQEQTSINAHWRSDTIIPDRGGILIPATSFNSIADKTDQEELLLFVQAQTITDVKK